MGARFFEGVALLASDEGSSLPSVEPLVVTTAAGAEEGGVTAEDGLGCLNDNWMTDLYEGGLLKKSLINELMLVVALRAITLILFSGDFNSCGFREEMTFLSLFI